MIWSLRRIGKLSGGDVAGACMAPNPETTQRLLVSAAEQLFAARGLDAVSLREITAAAGVRNSTAIQYHFGDREGVLRAVLRKHHAGVEQDRHARLDAYEAAGDPSLRPLVDAFVRPAAAKLADPDGGRAWLRITAQLANHPDPAWVASAGADRRDSTHRWRQLVAPHLPEVAVRRLHRRFTAIRITYVELARRAEAPARNDDLFTSHLVDLVTAVLDAPLSDETAALVDRRAR
jgi:AcrR family transcriptional regulator